MKRPFVLALMASFSIAVGVTYAGDKSTPDAKDLQQVVEKARSFLKSSQNANGSYSPKLAGPGITALVVAGLIRNGTPPDDPLIEKSLKFMESQVQKDGGIYNKFLANYTTSVAVMAFKDSNKNGKFDTILKNASDFLKGIQKEDDESKLAFGGFGYDGKSRPDLSNSGFAVEALLAAGVSKEDPAIKKALKFISRCQNLPGETNEQAFAKKTSEEDKGGFIYNPFEPEDGKHRTANGGLRSVGGMTYGGLKTFLYAGVSKEDPRVKACIDWCRRHYTLEENPGMGKSGLFYYYHTFSKAMNAFGEDPFVDAKGTKHAWRNELFTKLSKMQNANGSWTNPGERTFAEDNPDLCTAFALLSLSYVK